MVLFYVHISVTLLKLGSKTQTDLPACYALGHPLTQQQYTQWASPILTQGGVIPAGMLPPWVGG